MTTHSPALRSDDSALIFDECTFSDNKSDFQSGAINSWKCDLIISESEFIGNRSGVNYGAIGADSCTVIIDNAQFESNASVWGGALAANFGVLELTNSYFASNSSEHGGALISGWNSNHISNVTFEENSAIWGGAMSITNCDLNIIDCNYQRNQADESGAFEYIADTMATNEVYDVNITNTTFTENNSMGAVGTFKFIQLETEESLVDLNVDRCNFLNNSGDRVNILISSHIRNFKISNSIFSGNNTIRRTAGCNFADNVTGTVENCLFNSNFTSGGSSAASVGLNSNVAFINCTFANNYGDNGGAVTLRNNGNVLLLNSILWENKPYNSVLAAVTDSTPCTLDIYNSNIQYGNDSLMINDSISVINWGTGNIEANPFFVDSLNDFGLMDNSPCIGAGINSILIDDTWYYAPQYDIEGNTRPSPENSNPDQGAYEHNTGTPTGVNEIEDLPTEFHLAQNYPNPFNPSTTIKYTIPTTPSPSPYQGEEKWEGFSVSLKVYDILGRDVITLVNEKQRPGIYEITWDATDQTSGIYFYQIIAGEFIKTKKMILVK